MVEPSNENENGNCPVCLEVILDSESTTTTNCGHEYHFTCFMRAFQDSVHCSVCRADVFPERNNEDENRQSTSPEEDGEEDDDDEDEIVELSLDDLGEDMVEQIRSHIRQHLDSQLGNSASTNEYRRRRSIIDLFKASRDGNQTLVTSIIQENPDLKFSHDVNLNSILHNAVLSGSENLVRYMINDLNSPIDCYNIHRLSPIHFAVLARSSRILRLLINCGGNIDYPDGSGMSALMMSCHQGDSNLVQILLDNNANVNLFDLSGNTALHYAVMGRSNSCIRSILANSLTDQNVLNYFHNSPLHLACMNGSTSIVRILMSGCADPDLKNKAGRKPIELIASDNSRLRALVRDHSASST